jgi:hypothetical protein
MTNPGVGLDCHISITG